MFKIISVQTCMSHAYCDPEQVMASDSSSPYSDWRKVYKSYLKGAGVFAISILTPKVVMLFTLLDAVCCQRVFTSRASQSL